MSSEYQPEAWGQALFDTVRAEDLGPQGWELSLQLDGALIASALTLESAPRLIFMAVSVPSVGSALVHCVHEYRNLDNVHSGERSQELTFDFISAEAGILRRAQTVPGHQYQIEAWGKHIRSESPVELSLGVDLTGGEDWQAASVEWRPWDEAEEETWVHTQVAVRASGTSVTVFLKGYHQFAARGGATLFDDVRVVDLGP